MGTFKSTKTFFVSPALMPEIARNIASDFANDGYEVQTQELSTGGYDISITKGGVFKAIIGMKTALKVNIAPIGESIRIDAGVGIFGQQAIPTVISMLFFWPVLITQISGMISQAKMDDRVMQIASDTIMRQTYQQPRAATMNPGAAAGQRFCTQGGRPNAADAVYCSGCGQKLQ